MLQSLADAGPAMTRALSFYLTFPWPKETISNMFRGDYANLSLIFDLTLSRIDSGLFTGTRWEGDLTDWSCSGAGPSVSCRARTPAPTRWSCRTTGIRGGRCTISISNARPSSR